MFAIILCKVLKHLAIIHLNRHLLRYCSCSECLVVVFELQQLTAVIDFLLTFKKKQAFPHLRSYKI